jgi:hypothetical protein
MREINGVLERILHFCVQAAQHGLIALIDYEKEILDIRATEGTMDSRID